MKYCKVKYPKLLVLLLKCFSFSYDNGIIFLLLFNQYYYYIQIAQRTFRSSPMVNSFQGVV